MPRPRNLSLPREHPAVNPSDVIDLTHGGHTGPGIGVTCPECLQKRYIAARTLRQQILHPHFAGRCRKCWITAPWNGSFRSSRNPVGRRKLETGYVALGKNAISDEDLPMFNALRGSAGHVLEHRWVMSKFLNRALTSFELVDHMNGIHDDNRVSLDPLANNLRLYVRGKQQAGSAPGHGTYYHEWQMALKELHDLKAKQ